MRLLLHINNNISLELPTSRTGMNQSYELPPQLLGAIHKVRTVFWRGWEVRCVRSIYFEDFFHVFLRTKIRLF